MAKPSTKDWRNRAIEDWNVTTFHAYLIDKNREHYDVEYQPFGKGPVSKRWLQEQGQLKQAITKYGPEIVKYYIDKCFVNYKFDPKNPVLSFGFMYSYMRNELAQAEVEIKRGTATTKIDAEVTQVDDDITDWF